MLFRSPTANRVHIAFYGKRNSGKSSLINAITGQTVSIVSDVAGTTTDPVYKPMEISGIGPCMLIDTAGFDDVGELGGIRVEKTQKVAQKTDVAVLLFTEQDIKQEGKWFEQLSKDEVPVITVINKMDQLQDIDNLKKCILDATKIESIVVSAKTRHGIPLLIEEMVKKIPDDFEKASIRLVPSPTLAKEVNQFVSYHL